LTSGLLFLFDKDEKKEEAAGQKLGPNVGRRDVLWPKGTKSRLLLGPFSPFWGVCHSGQGRFLPFLGLLCQKMSKMGP
jgi:hypothetical protein